MIQSFVDLEDFVGLDVFDEVDVVERFADRAGAAFEAFATACGVDEDTAHGFGGGGEEVGAAVEVGVVGADEAEPGFVDESGGLEGVAGGFLGHFVSGDTAEFVVHERQEFGGGDLATADRDQDAREIVHRGRSKAGRVRQSKRGGWRMRGCGWRVVGWWFRLAGGEWRRANVAAT